MWPRLRGGHCLRRPQGCWGVSHSELLLSLLEEDKPKREASGASSFKGFFLASQAQQPFPQTAQGTGSTAQPQGHTFYSALLSTRKSEVAAAQTQLARQLGFGVGGREDRRKQNSAVEGPSPSGRRGSCLLPSPLLSSFQRIAPLPRLPPNPKSALCKCPLPMTRAPIRSRGSKDLLTNLGQMQSS